MSKLPARQPHPLLDAIYEINTARDHVDFASAALASMSRLIPADYCHIHVMDRASGRVIEHSSPAVAFTPEEIAYYGAHPHENALVAYYERTGDKRARRLSDVVNVAHYRRTEFYRRCLRRLGINHTLALPIAADEHTVAALAFDRRRTDFTLRHRALLDAFAPHFLLAWQRHENPWREGTKTKPTARQKLLALGLTAREADVLYWMTEGKQNREIATILHRSLETVQEHVGNLVRKLGQENRHATTVFALGKLRAR